MRLAMCMQTIDMPTASPTYTHVQVCPPSHPPVAPVLCLSVNLGVEVDIMQHDDICTRQVETLTTRARREKENKDILGGVVELVDNRQPILHLRVMSEMETIRRVAWTRVLPGGMKEARDPTLQGLPLGEEYSQRSPSPPHICAAIKPDIREALDLHVPLKQIEGHGPLAKEQNLRG